jgi:geranylgeranyl diphosphate synthase type I
MSAQKVKSITLQKYSEYMLPAIEKEMKQCVAITNRTGLEELYHMLAYHLGWEGPDAGPKASGKRVRPLLVVLTTEAAGSDWEKALPAAAAVELVHNFSLIHDDIQDNSPLRRGRKTVWKKWNISQAINAGDSMFSLAHIALERLQGKIEPELVIKAQSLLPMACLRLTQGQYLDLSYEHRADLVMYDYWPMISSKTASLIATCTELGALIAGADETKVSIYREFGQYVGLAFQVQDDILGIWGDYAVTGNSTESDLVEGKISLPVFYALEHSQTFTNRWQQGSISPEEVPEIADLLKLEGAYDYAQNEAERLTEHALSKLEEAEPAMPAAGALRELAEQLTKRQS